MSYILMIVGLVTMCVPEEASLTRFIIQGGIGLGLFFLGANMTYEDDSSIK